MFILKKPYKCFHPHEKLVECIHSILTKVLDRRDYFSKISWFLNEIDRRILQNLCVNIINYYNYAIHTLNILLHYVGISADWIICMKIYSECPENRKYYLWHKPLLVVQMFPRFMQFWYGIDKILTSSWSEPNRVIKFLQVMLWAGIQRAVLRWFGVLSNGLRKAHAELCM